MLAHKEKWRIHICHKWQINMSPYLCIHAKIFIKKTALMETEQAFATLLNEFQYHYDLASVFEDFLTMSVTLGTRNPLVRLSYDEPLYLKMIDKYKAT
jgi:hypothetical protein